MATTINRKPIFDAFRAILKRGLTAAEVTQLDAAIDVAEGVPQRPHGLANAAAFFASVRTWADTLEQSQVDGFTFLLGAMGEAGWPISWTAYGLATGWWETNKQLEPVKEAYWLSEDWRKAHLRYYPWYGRGYVQLTWEANYRRADEELGLDGALIAEPDCALRPDVAARVMVRGMAEGWFSGKKLGDYLPAAGPASVAAFKAARPIINGMDKASEIAQIAVAFQTALEAGSWA